MLVFLLTHRLRVRTRSWGEYLLLWDRN
jgi:hypothetical protein